MRGGNEITIGSAGCHSPAVAGAAASRRPVDLGRALPVSARGPLSPHVVRQAKENKWGRAAGHADLRAKGFFNPYFAPGTSADLRVALYRDWLLKSDDWRAERCRARLHLLRGKILVCTCSLTAPCYCGVLLELANA